MIPGTLKSVKAIGWFIEEYGVAQISMNLTNISITPVHVAFDEVCSKALDRGIRVTGSELVGLVPPFRYIVMRMQPWHRNGGTWPMSGQANMRD